MTAGAHRLEIAGSSLRTLCAVLAVTDDRNDDLRRLVGGGEVNWPEVLRLAGGHLVTPSLAGALRRKGILELLDPELQDYLDAVRGLNRQRNDILFKQMGEIGKALNGVNVTPLLLKGAVALLPGQYPGAEDRVLGDLDLLIPLQHIEGAQEALRQIGYRDATEEWKFMASQSLREMHHVVPLLHSDLPVSVELHHRVLFDTGDDAVLRQGMATRQVPHPAGASLLIPDPSSRLAHNFLNIQISDGLAARHGASLRQLLEFASIARFHAPEFDARSVSSCLAPGRLRLLAEYWALAERWLAAPYPPDLERSPHEWWRLQVIEKVATRNRWRRLSNLLWEARRSPGRVMNLIVRLRDQPEYFPALARRLFSKGSKN